MNFWALHRDDRKRYLHHRPRTRIRWKARFQWIFEEVSCVIISILNFALHRNFVKSINCPDYFFSFALWSQNWIFSSEISERPGSSVGIPINTTQRVTGSRIGNPESMFHRVRRCFQETFLQEPLISRAPLRDQLWIPKVSSVLALT